MSGVFEAALARIEQMEKFLQQHGPAIMAIAAQMQSGGGQPQQTVQHAPQNNGQQFGATLGGFNGQPNTSQPVQQFGGLTAAQPVQQAQATVTPDMIQQLVMPLVQNEQAKGALQQHMQAMGIQNLGDTRPDQMAELYQRFQQVQQQFGGATQQTQPVQQTAAPSII
jgi:hypothetical protein